MTLARKVFRNSLLAVAVAAALSFSAGVADARPGSGFSMGSRGTRTFSMPAPTATAPRPSSPIDRTMTAPGQTSPGAFQASRPQGGLFGGSFGRGLIGGFLGAGLFGMLFGGGFFGGLGSMTSMIGLVIQLGLLYMVVRFAMNWFASRQPATAGGPSVANFNANPVGGGSGGDPGLHIEPDDFSAFEHLLGLIQSAYSAEDLDTLRGLITPEMASYFAEEIANNAKKGVVNRITGVKLQQGDLSEAWRDADGDYATVAMRFALVDTMLDRNTGALVSGDPTNPETVTELWTFRRPLGTRSTAWKLSAIQQA